MTVILHYMAIHGSLEGPLFKWADGRPLTRKWFVDQIQAALTRVGIDAAAPFGLVPQARQPQAESVTPSSRPWATGPVMHFSCTPAFRNRSSYPSPPAGDLADMTDCPGSFIGGMAFFFLFFLLGSVHFIIVCPVI